MYVTLLMDVEDLVALEADDMAATCAEILHAEGLTATFCIVGEKARLLKERGRQDVIESLKRHDIGLHTDFHSVHPTIVEYLAIRDWEEGVAEAIRREAPGVQAIRDVFDISPSCWGGPGNTWGPAICEALCQMDVPAFVYAHTRIPEGSIHRFADVLAYPTGRSLPDSHYQDDDRSQQDLHRLVQDLQADAQRGLFWQEVFLGHPTRILHERFWDDPTFAAGANPPRQDWHPTPRKSPQALDRALANFRQAARTLRSLPGIERRTIRQMNELLSLTPAGALSLAEQEQVWPEIERNLLSMANWPILPPHLDLTSLCQQTRHLLPTLERFDTTLLPQSAPHLFAS